MLPLRVGLVLRDPSEPRARRRRRARVSTLVVSVPGSGPLRVAVEATDALVRAALPALLREAGAVVEADPDARAAADVAVWTDGASDSPRDVSGDGTVPALALVSGDGSAEAAWRTGARGLLRRDADPGDLLAALAAVARGLVVVDAALARTLVGDRLGEPRRGEPAEPLTPRETETLALLAEGLPNKLVADRLGVSERTARYHVAQILAKLGAQSRTEAVVAGARLGLVTL